MTNLAHGQFAVTLNVPPEPAPTSVGAGAQLNLFDGGWIDHGFQALADSEVNVFGGLVGEDFQALGDSTLNISGGTIGDFLYAGAWGDAAGNVSVNIAGGSVGQNFSTGRSTGGDLNVDVTISGGSVDNFFAAFGGSAVEVAGGSIGSHSEANSGSVIHVSAGVLGSNFDAYQGSVVNISGGSVGVGFNANAGSMVHISGGLVDMGFDANGGSMVNLSGGSIADGFTARTGSQVKIFGTQFVLDGSDITPTLTLNAPATVAERDVSLSGMLADGSPFSFDLNSSDFVGEDQFLPDALLQLTLVQPGNVDPVMLFPSGDFDLDRDVDGADFLAWQRGQSPRLLSGEDLTLWQSGFGKTMALGSVAASAVIPEPSAWIIALSAIAVMPVVRRRYEKRRGRA